jgi:hypothetical protein
MDAIEQTKGIVIEKVRILVARLYAHQKEFLAAEQGSRPFIVEQCRIIFGEPHPGGVIEMQPPQWRKGEEQQKQGGNHNPGAIANDQR